MDAEPLSIAGHLFCGHAADIMASWPGSCIDLIITSPPYWTAVAYDGHAIPWPTYDAYLQDMLRVWTQCERVLRPNGKLCINAPIMPIPKRLIAQHTRHLKNIAFDMEHLILTTTDLARYSLFIWQKQTSKMMFGSYPYPGNIIENNTIEFINVYVKLGPPVRLPPAVKAANKLRRAEWLDLTQQLWFMYPEDVKRGGDHPAPFPQKLPARLMRLYSFAACADYPGALVLDPFVGTGTTCAVAQSMGRRWVGIDVSASYLQLARKRIAEAMPFAPPLLVGRPKFPTRDELRKIASQEAGTSGRRAEAKHKRRSYGRRAAGQPDPQLPLA